jgi:hypothetical protein
LLYLAFVLQSIAVQLYLRRRQYTTAAAADDDDDDDDDDDVAVGKT